MTYVGVCFVGDYDTLVALIDINLLTYHVFLWPKIASLTHGRKRLSRSVFAIKKNKIKTKVIDATNYVLFETIRE